MYGDRANLRRLFICFILFIFASMSFAEEQNKKFVVGLILPLSGELAEYGESLKNGFELAQEEEPEKFKYIELRYQDSRYDQKTALTVFNALEQQGGVNLYHTWGVSPNETILPIANTRGRPVVAESSMRSSAVNRPYVVRVARTGYDAAEKLVKVFVKKKWKRVGIVVSQIPYYEDIADALKVFGKEYGVSIEVVADVTPSEVDFKSTLLKAKHSNYDAFGPLLLMNQLLAFCDQAKAIDFTTPMFGAHIHNSLSAMKSCAPLSKGAVFPGQIVSTDFHDRYLKRFKNDLRIDSAAHSYETAKIIADLFGNPDSYKYSAKEILEKLKTVNKSDSSIGAYKYSESVEGGKAISFNEIILTFDNKQIIPMK